MRVDLLAPLAAGMEVAAGAARSLFGALLWLGLFFLIVWAVLAWASRLGKNTGRNAARDPVRTLALFWIFVRLFERLRRRPRRRG